ncbi:hypothetical protein SAMN05216357_1355 [Porphyromonadaceae bacterium KH3CP3RA]|nr:hypothetical protein SAMN05216357_1355 [Porphyromonadaceae bacterium KH3CP3RA]
MKDNLINYQDLRVLAVSQGVPDNKVSIGMWAKANGYYKMRKTKDGKVTIYYYKMNELQEN